MTLAIDRTVGDARMREVRALLSLIQTLEDTAIPPVDSGEVKTLRGLFFVHLYGAFEKSVNEAFEAYFRAVTSLRVVSSHLVVRTWPSAFDSCFKSLQAVNGGGWKSRKKLIEASESAGLCTFADGLFSDQLQNVWAETIESAIDYLGLPAVPWVNAETLYLDEVVSKRNQVAHGRTSPVEVGASGRSADLALRLAAMESLLTVLINHLEKQIGELPFVRREHRAGYVI